MKAKSLVLILSILFCLTSFSQKSTYASEEGTTTLPTPDWTYKIPSEYYVVLDPSDANATNDRVYFQVYKNSNPFIAYSFNKKDGKDNWNYDFKGNAKPFVVYDPYFDYGKNGDVYFLNQKNKETTFKLNAVNSQGKLKWSKSLKRAGRLVTLSNGDLIITSSEKNKKTSNWTLFYDMYDSNGNLKLTKSLENPGSTTVLKNGRVLVESRTLELFKSINDLTKPIFTYKIPQGYSLDSSHHSAEIEPILSLSGGSTLLNISNSELKKRMIVAFDAKGNKKWTRPLPYDSIVEKVGNGFIVQSENKFELYDVNNKLKISKEIGDDNLWMTVMPNDEVVVTSTMVANREEGKYYDTLYVLDPINLSFKHNIKITSESKGYTGYSFYYAGNNDLYVSTGGRGKTLSKYTLK